MNAASAGDSRRLVTSRLVPGSPTRTVTRGSGHASDDYAPNPQPWDDWNGEMGTPITAEHKS